MTTSPPRFQTFDDPSHAKGSERIEALREERFEGRQTLAEFMARRFDRCKLVVEGSLQISRWELEGARDADFDGVTARVGMAVAAPL